MYSAKEAKWYRRNVERREHCQFNSPSPPQTPFLCFVKFLLLPRLRFSGVASLSPPPPFVRRGPIAKFESSSSFAFLLFLLFIIFYPTRRDLPRSNPLLKVRFNYITCCSCQATRGYKTLPARAVLTGAITKYGVDRAAR